MLLAALCACTLPWHRSVWKGEVIHPDCSGKNGSGRARVAVIPISALSDTLSQCWYSNQLHAMGEGSLADRHVSARDTIIRATFLPSFQHGVSVRVERTAAGTVLEATEATGGGGLKPGKPIRHVRRRLSDSVWSSLDALVRNRNLWSITTTIDSLNISPDGTSLLMELRSDERYQFIERANDSDAIDPLMNILLSLADMPSYGVVRVIARDRASHIPARQVNVMRRYFGRRGSAVDSAGVGTIDSVPIGRQRIDVACRGGQRIPGAILASRDVNVRYRDTATLNVSVDQSLCVLRPFGVQRMTLTGRLRKGSQVLEFEPVPDSISRALFSGIRDFNRVMAFRYRTDSLELRSWPRRTPGKTDFFGPCWLVTATGLVRGPDDYELHMTYEFVVDSIVKTVPLEDRRCA
jgi:hypothetical protein